LGYPPSPHPSEDLDWRGVCKKCLQNLDVKELRGQNLDNKGVRASVAVFVYTASAMTIIRSFLADGKVRCHMRPVNHATLSTRPRKWGTCSRNKRLGVAV
jgi:hypothetical protein